MYANGRTWSELCEAAGLAVAPAGPEEASLRRACGRLLHVDDAARIAAYRAFLARENAPQAGDMTERDRRFLRMLVGSLVDKVPRAALAKQASPDDGCGLLWAGRAGGVSRALGGARVGRRRARRHIPG